MKNKTTLFISIIYIIISIVCCLIAVGLIRDNFIVTTILTILICLAASYFFVTALITFVDLIENLFKSKKKTKDKRIRLKVVFTQDYDEQPILVTQIFSGICIEHCIAYAKEYAKQYNCQIKSITRLTTED